jgi:hypothetical protein
LSVMEKWMVVLRGVTVASVHLCRWLAAADMLQKRGGVGVGRR